MVTTLAASERDLVAWAHTTRAKLELGFDFATAQPGSAITVPSSGQCAVVAAIVYEILGGQLVSAIVEGESHWFNRVATLEGQRDIDLTADQFCQEQVRIAPAGDLYPNTKERQAGHLTPETKRRIELLKRRSGVSNQLWAPPSVSAHQ